MAATIPAPDETEMNMTPMIDVVFQLIVFFLLSLKFRSVEERIQSELPHGRGIRPDDVVVDELPTLTVKLFRLDASKGQARAFTRIRVENRATFDLPQGSWTGTDEPTGGALGDRERQRIQDARKRGIERVIARIWAERGHDPELRGEIKTPPPFGLGVPHGDVILVVDAFLEAGITDVKFVGAIPPIPRRGGGGIVMAD
ncbi:MAG: biopolymer transporter ExbD [Planctomycetota bacterium]